MGPSDLACQRRRSLRPRRRPDPDSAPPPGYSRRDFLRAIGVTTLVSCYLPPNEFRTVFDIRFQSAPPILCPPRVTLLPYPLVPMYSTDNRSTVELTFRGQRLIFVPFLGADPHQPENRPSSLRQDAFRQSPPTPNPSDDTGP